MAMTEERGRERGPDRHIWEKIYQRIEMLTEEMEGELTEEDLRDLWYRRALELSRFSGPGLETDRKRKVVVFRLGSDRYGVSLDRVREIQRAGRITPVPTAPDFVVGVMNLRGNILSIIDIRIFFGLPKVTVSEKTRILVVEGEGLKIGILVEQVDEIHAIDEADVKPPLSLNKAIVEDYIKGIATHRGEMLIMVDLGKILRNPRLVVEENV
jgi:purine-binding chemotaxis protein CheW